MSVKIVVAPQEFKGSLTSREAASAMAAGARRAAPQAALNQVPLADGGPGFVDAVVMASNGLSRSATVLDPLGRSVDASFGLIEDGRTAVIEMAAASGMSLLRTDELDPYRASSYGTGLLVRSAMDLGVRRIIIGLGGSATNDGGAGMAQALGVRLLDARGNELKPGGAALLGLDHLDISGVDARVADTEFLAATDVSNPLCGSTGASAIYGPQKGATAAMVKTLDRALKHYAIVVRRQFGIDVLKMPGAGAAGGLGAGAVAFLHAKLLPGFPLVAEVARLAERLDGADLVLTGEGRLDRQTAYGKTLAGLASMASQARIPLVAIVGMLDSGYEKALPEGITAAFSIIPAPMGLDEARSHAGQYLAARTQAVVQTFLAGRSGHA